MNLDDLLAGADPAPSRHDDDVMTDLRLLAQAAEEQGRPRPRRRRWQSVAAALGVVAVAGTATAATGLVPLPGWLAPGADGGSCRVEYLVAPREPGSGEPAHPGTGDPALVARTTAEAEEYLATYDFDAVDRDRAVAEFRAEEAAIIAAAPPGERQPALAGGELVASAVSAVVVDDLHAHLAAEGLDPYDVELTTLTDRCML